MLPDDYGLLDLLPLLIAGIGVGRGWRFPMNADEEELGGTINNGYLLENGTDLYLMENGTDFYIQES
jgi:hypothetical protein